MPSVFIPTIREFVARHGQGTLVTDAKLRGCGRYVCHDGASYSQDGYNMSLPPTDERERLLLKTAYWQTKLAQEVQDFTAYKQDVFVQAHLAARFANLPSAGDPAEIKKTLAAGKQRIAQYRERIAELRAYRDALTDLPAKQRALDAAARNRQAKAREIMDALNSVVLDGDLHLPNGEEESQGENDERNR